MINLDKDTYLRRGLSLSETVDFNQPSSRLIAEPIKHAEPIGERGDPAALPPEIKRMDFDLRDGSKNGDLFMAYSFYIKNAGTEIVDYSFSIIIDEVTKNVDSAVRVMIIKEFDVTSLESSKESNVYAKVQGEYGESPGEPEVGTIPFISNLTVTNQRRNGFDVGQIDRYTVIVWLHGEDVDCTDEEGRSIINGIFKMSMGFKVLEE